jgi:protein tyrosine phosphatase
MFTADDFKISMEKELRLRMVNDEINNCSDVEELRKQLINVTRLFTQYQHLLEVAVKQLMVQSISDLEMFGKIEIPKE